MMIVTIVPDRVVMTIQMQMGILLLIKKEELVNINQDVEK